MKQVRDGIKTGLTSALAHVLLAYYGFIENETRNDKQIKQIQATTEGRILTSDKYHYLTKFVIIMHSHGGCYLQKQRRISHLRSFWTERLIQLQAAKSHRKGIKAIISN